MALPRFGLNRFDARSVDAFAADVRRAETLGWDAAFQPDSQLRRRDTYVLMAAAARVTERILLATLLSNPVNRHPTVTASSIATVDELAPGRTLLGWGVGDTAVRLAGLKPARVSELESSTRLMRALLDGRGVDVGAREPARLPHHRPVPIWIAAGGPRTLRMAGGVADGVFIRVGTHQANITRSIEEIRAGAAAAGRDPSKVGLGAVFHTVLVEDPTRALTIGKSMAAGYYEYSPMLFEPPRLSWSGPDPEKLKREGNVFPDFHHAPDLAASGKVVDFLPDIAADAFCLRGGPAEIVKQLLAVLQSAPAAFDYVCLHPIPNPTAPDDPERGFMARVAREVLPPVRAALGAGSRIGGATMPSSPPNPPPGLKVRQRTRVSARARQQELPPQLQKYVETGEALIAEPFKGITAAGRVAPGLFKIQKTGASTRQITDAARAFVDSLSEPQRERALFPLESDAWRRWSNIHPYLMRHGLSLDEMSPAQRDRALALVRESLSAQGFKTARDVMRLNELVLAITGSQAEYGEWLYWLSVMGIPSHDGPWGWQIDGHHLIINCFVLGDQIVMTPMFMGSEPVAATEGPYAGTRVFQAEERQGLALMRALTPEQRQRAILAPELPTEVFTAAFRDNVEMQYQGIVSGDLTTTQQRMLLDVLETYIGRIRPGHSEARRNEVKRHLNHTYFAWMGGTDEDGVFYYRIHSPVILIEFDHQRGIAFDNDAPSRHHIHTVVRTPNGNDYGRDLLRQHHARFDHTRADHNH